MGSAYAAYQHSAIHPWNGVGLPGVLLQAVDMLILSAGLYIWRQLPLVGRLAAPVVSHCLAKDHICNSQRTCLLQQYLLCARQHARLLCTAWAAFMRGHQ